VAKVQSIKRAQNTRQQKSSHVCNDNELKATVTISFTELAEGMQVDEDVLLQRLAGILNKEG
jgi:hypothetical protein